MSFLRKTKVPEAGLVVLLALASWTAMPASAEIPPRGDFVVNGSATPDPAGSESQVTYTITVKNESTVTATGVAVTMNMPVGAALVRCTFTPAPTAPPTPPPVQTCTESAGIVTTTYPKINAHITARITLVLKMPVVSQDFTASLFIRAHADSAVGGNEPRDGTFTVAATILPPSTQLSMSPSGRVVTVPCGGTVNAATFGDDIEARMLTGLVCSGSGLTFTAIGKTLNLAGKTIFSSQRVPGNAGIIVGPDAANVTIKGGGTEGTKGIEQFEYCVKDLGGNTGLHITDLRCFRPKAAGILTLSNGVQIDSSLVDRATADATVEIKPGGVGIEAGGDNLRVKDTILRRSGTIGFWAYGVDTDGSGLVSSFEGTPATPETLATSRIERNFGTGVLLSRGPHKITATTVQAEEVEPPALPSVEGIVVAGDAIGTVLDKVVIKKHGGDGIRVDAGAVGTVIERVTLEEIGGDGYAINAPSTLNGNSAKTVLGDAFLINAAASLNSNSAEQCSGDAFVINAAANVDSNQAIDNEGYGFVLTNVSSGGGMSGWSVQGVGDFNGDGKVDVLWRRPSGALAMMLMNGSSASNLVQLGTVHPSWTVAAVEDFDGDGKADILWRQTTTGYVVVWLMNGPVATQAWVSQAPLDWTIAAVNDFNGDGKADVLWRHTSGGVVVWLMNGSVATQAWVAPAPLDWTIAAVNDFNGDGKADVLWRHTSGGVVVWLMNGSVATQAWVAPAALDWTIAGLGDVNGDGRADVLWRHTLGGVVVWLMNGPVATQVWVASAALDWTIAAVDDFSGDGMADILWRRTSGALVMWLMDGPIPMSVPAGTLDTGWTMAKVGDLDSDQRADILWLHSSGLLSTWFGPTFARTTGAARLITNTAEGNALGGFAVSGSGNVMKNNAAKSNGGKGFGITGAANALDTNAAERSTGAEFVLSQGNIDANNNRANGTRFSFPPAGGTFE